jgi:hypothetical protein
MNIFGDFCFCNYNPVMVALAICAATTVLGGAVAGFFLWRKSKNAVALGKLYPGWAVITGASCGLGKKVCKSFSLLISSIQVP